MVSVVWPMSIENSISSSPYQADTPANRTDRQQGRARQPDPRRRRKLGCQDGNPDMFASPDQPGRRQEDPVDLQHPGGFLDPAGGRQEGMPHGHLVEHDQANRGKQGRGDPCCEAGQAMDPAEHVRGHVQRAAAACSSSAAANNCSPRAPAAVR